MPSLQSSEVDIDSRQMSRAISKTKSRN